MSGNQPAIPARYYARMGEVLQVVGINVLEVLALARVSPELLAEPEALLRLDQVERLIAAVLELSGRPELALETGRALKITSHSIVGYAMLSSPTIADAMRLLARYFRLVMPAFGMRYRLEGDRLEFNFQPVLPMSQPCLIFHLEAMAMAIYMALRELLEQRLPPYDLYLSIAKPAHAARYAEMPEARCHFLWEASPGIRLSFPAEIAGRKLALADPAAFRMAEERCRELVQHVLASGKVSDWVGMMLREASDGIPSLTELAQTLNLSARTLDRYLKNEGKGFRPLFLQVRHERALALLDAGHLTVTQIAYELGYTDAANFTRAFRREAGMSPSAYAERAAT